MQSYLIVRKCLLNFTFHNKYTYHEKTFDNLLSHESHFQISYCLSLSLSGYFKSTKLKQFFSNVVLNIWYQLFLVSFLKTVQIPWRSEIYPEMQHAFYEWVNASSQCHQLKSITGFKFRKDKHNYKIIHEMLRFGLLWHSFPNLVQPQHF